MDDLAERVRIVVELPADRVALTSGQVLQASWRANNPTVVTVSVCSPLQGNESMPVEVWNGEFIELDFPVIGGVVQRDLVEDAVRERVEMAQRDQEDPANRVDEHVDVSGGWAAWDVGDWLWETPLEDWPASAAEAVEQAARDDILLTGDFQKALESKRSAESDDGDDD